MKVHPAIRGEELSHESVKRPTDVLDHATSEIGVGTKLGFDATRRLPGEAFKRPWPPLTKWTR